MPSKRKGSIKIFLTRSKDSSTAKPKSRNGSSSNQTSGYRIKAISAIGQQMIKSIIQSKKVTMKTILCRCANNCSEFKNLFAEPNNNTNQIIYVSISYTNNSATDSYTSGYIKFFTRLKLCFPIVILNRLYSSEEFETSSYNNLLSTKILLNFL